MSLAEHMIDELCDERDAAREEVCQLRRLLKKAADLLQGQRATVPLLREIDDYFDKVGGDDGNGG